MSTKLLRAGMALAVALGVVSLAAATKAAPQMQLTPVASAGVELVIPDSVVPQFVALATESWQTWTESARCVERYTIVPKDGVTVVTIYKLGKTPEAIVGDSVTIRNVGQVRTICNDSMPLVHTHLPSNGDWYPRPSELDVLRLSERPQVPFGLIVAIKDSNAFGVVIFRAVPTNDSTR